jgi:hypothetical protein
LLCIITSQVESRKDYYSLKQKDAVESLIDVDKNILPILKKPESVIDCNNPHFFLTQSELLNRIDSKHGIELITRDIPDSLKIQIISAIKESPLVKPYIKNLLTKIE